MNNNLKMFLSSMILLANAELVHSVTPGAYFGAGGGYSRLQNQEDFANKNEGGFGGRLFFGYNLVDFFGIEANYTAFDNTQYQWNQNRNISVNYQLNAFDLVGKLYIPTEGPLNFYGLFGLAHVNADMDVKYRQFPILNDSSSGFVGTLGAGLNIDVSEHFQAGFEVSVFGDQEASEYADPVNRHFGFPGSTLATFSLAYKL